MSHSALLSEFVSFFYKQGKPILDLACGNGRNGLFLHQQGFPVQFADKNCEAIEILKRGNSLNSDQCL